MLRYIFENFFIYFNVCFPKIRKRVKPKQYRYNIPQLLKQRELLVLYQTLSLVDESYKESFKKCKDIYKQSINTAQRSYISNFINSADNIIKRKQCGIPYTSKQIISNVTCIKRMILLVHAENLISILLVTNLWILTQSI